MKSNLRRIAVIIMAAAALIAASSIVPSTAECAQVSLTEVMNGLQRHYRDTKSFSAKFVEHIAPVGGAERTRQGSVFFRKPGEMRWNYEEPSRELIVSDGKQLYDYDPELNQVVEAPLAQALRSPGAQEFLLGVGDISKDFNASLIDPSATDGLMHLRLVPKKEGNTVELVLEAGSFNIQTIRVIDQLGNVTALKFSAIESNVQIPDSTFAYTPPDGVDIVRPPLSK